MTASCEWRHRCCRATSAPRLQPLHGRSRLGGQHHQALQHRQEDVPHPVSWHRVVHPQGLCHRGRCCASSAGCHEELYSSDVSSPSSSPCRSWPQIHTVVWDARWSFIQSSKRWVHQVSSGRIRAFASTLTMKH